MAEATYTMYFYIYTVKRDDDRVCYIYERTCCSEERAKEWVAELQRRGEEAIYLINHVINGAYY